MNKEELEKLWSDTLRSSAPTPEQFEQIAKGVVDIYRSGDLQFQVHLNNRFKQTRGSSGIDLDPELFDITTARDFVADEIGYPSWDELIRSIEQPTKRPVIFQYAIAAMERGDFSALESMVGGASEFDDTVIDWYDKGYFDDELEALAEIFSAACMLGHDKSAAYLLDKGVDPYGGMKTGLSGFHYAASSGRLNVIKLLIDKKTPMEIRNMYGGTVFEQAIWSAVNEHTPPHAAIVEALIDAGAVVEPGYMEWWEKQHVPSAETKLRVAAALKRHDLT